MQLKSVLNTGVMTIAACVIAYPATAQPIPPRSAEACIQRTAEALVVSAANIEVTGAGPVDALKGTRTLFLRDRTTGQTAECLVNTIDHTVLSVRITSTRPPVTPPPQPGPGGTPAASVNACIQRTAEALVVPVSNIEVTSAGPLDALKGTRTLFLRDRTTGQTAECLVNTIDHTVLSVRITSTRPPVTPPPSTGRPVPPSYQPARSCQAVIGGRIRSDFTGVQQVSFATDTTRAFFISNAEEKIRGEGQFAQRSGSWNRFRYDCVVNIRTGRVGRTNYSLIR
jgi:hypothetical protein